MESCCMPEDVIRNILLRLPVKSLLRCRCVCKSWRTLISSKFFITQHLHIQSTSNNDNRILVFNGSPDAHLLVFDDDTLDAVVIPKPFVDDDIILHHYIVGACNGILCILLDDIFDFKDDFIPTIELWNPATKEVKVLPIPLITLHSKIAFGFGFDARTIDYKVVQIADSVPPAVAVYSLSTNCWKEIDSQVPFFRFHRWSGISTYLDGIYYWWASNENDDMLLSFDMADEEFQMTPLPNGEIYEPYLISLSVLRGSIALIVHKRDYYDDDDDFFLSGFDIWLIDKRIKNSSWVKHSTVELEPLLSLRRPLGFGLNDEILLVGYSRLLSYDLESQVVRNPHGDYGLPIVDGGSIQVVVYKESLVSLQT